MSLGVPKQLFLFNELFSTRVAVFGGASSFLQAECCRAWAGACSGSDPTADGSLGPLASFPCFDLALWLHKERLCPIFPVPVLSTMALKLKVGDLNIF